MTILWRGGEDIDFPNGRTPLIANFYRSGYARHSLAALDSSVTGNTKYECIGTTFAGGAVTSCWLRFMLYVSGDCDTSWPIAGLTKSTKTLGEGLWVGIGSNSQKLRLITWDGSSQVELTAESGLSLPVGYYSISMELVGYGATATVRVYVGSNKVIEITDTDVRISSLTDLDRVVLMGNAYLGRAVVSEVIVADQDTRTLSLVTHAPSAAGDANAWTGAYDDINEESISDATVVYTDTPDLDAQFNLSNSPAGDFSVVDICIKARACKSADATIQTLELGVKSGGSVEVDAGRTLSTAWETYESVKTTIGGSAITTAILNDLQLDLQSET